MSVQMVCFQSPICRFKFFCRKPIELMASLTDAQGMRLDIADTNQTASAVTPKERRRARRFHCDGLVEVNRLPSTGKREGKLKDLSQHGCHIEMDRPFPVPSYVEVMIRIDGMRLRLTGTVRGSRETGMGIEFDQISASGKRVLQEFIVELDKDHDSDEDPIA